MTTRAALTSRAHKEVHMNVYMTSPRHLSNYVIRQTNVRACRSVPTFVADWTPATTAGAIRVLHSDDVLVTVLRLACVSGLMDALYAASPQALRHTSMFGPRA